MTAGTTATKTILIAGESSFVRDRFQAVLQEAGHRALIARSGAEVLGRIRADLAGIDLLVLDLRLPQTPGVELMRTIRKLDGGRLPILVFSGSISSAEEVRELASLGVAGYVNEYSAVQHILPSLAPHLFPDNFNRRLSPRVVLSIPVAYRCGDTITAVLSLNIGKGGLSVRTMSPLAVATSTRLRFSLPGADRDIDADARVTWSDHRIGMGLQFSRLAPADQALIDEFVDQHFFTARA
jgi:two-component system chemotaxis response regulator CheY